MPDAIAPKLTPDELLHREIGEKFPREFCIIEFPGDPVELSSYDTRTTNGTMWALVTGYHEADDGALRLTMSHPVHGDQVLTYQPNKTKVLANTVKYLRSGTVHRIPTEENIGRLVDDAINRQKGNLVANVSEALLLSKTASAEVTSLRQLMSDLPTPAAVSELRGKAVKAELTADHVAQEMSKIQATLEAAVARLLEPVTKRIDRLDRTLGGFGTRLAELEEKAQRLAAVEDGMATLAAAILDTDDRPIVTMDAPPMEPVTAARIAAAEVDAVMADMEARPPRAIKPMKPTEPRFFSVLGTLVADSTKVSEAEVEALLNAVALLDNFGQTRKVAITAGVDVPAKGASVQQLVGDILDRIRSLSGKPPQE